MNKTSSVANNFMGNNGGKAGYIQEEMHMRIEANIEEVKLEVIGTKIHNNCRHVWTHRALQLIVYIHRSRGCHSYQAMQQRVEFDLTELNTSHGFCHVRGSGTTLDGPGTPKAAVRAVIRIRKLGRDRNATTRSSAANSIASTTSSVDLTIARKVEHLQDNSATRSSTCPRAAQRGGASSNNEAVELNILATKPTNISTTRARQTTYTNRTSGDGSAVTVPDSRWNSKETSATATAIKSDRLPIASVRVSRCTQRRRASISTVAATVGANTSTSTIASSRPNPIGRNDTLTFNNTSASSDRAMIDDQQALILHIQ